MALQGHTPESMNQWSEDHLAWASLLLERGVVGWFKDLNQLYYTYLNQFVMSGENGPKPTGMGEFSPIHELIRDVPLVDQTLDAKFGML